MFEDFYYSAGASLNETSADTIRDLQAQKAHYIKRAQQLKELMAKSVEIAAKIKEKGSKTKDGLMQKIYQTRASEESAKQQLYATRMEAIQQATKVADLKISVANLRLQNKAKRQA